MIPVMAIAMFGALGLGLAEGAVAAPGDLDATFGTEGVARVDIGYFDDATDLEIQQDRKIVAVGTVSASSRNVYVFRLLEDGTLDPSFGAGGIVVPDRYHQLGPSVVLQPDGKIILATRGESDGGSVFLYRFDAAGSPDPTFGVAGIATLLPPTGSIAGVAGVALVADAKILVVLRCDTFAGTTNIAFARFAADGTPDGTFGSGGFVVVPGNRLPFGLEVQPDGRILVSGGAMQPGRPFSDAYVARFNPDGTPDPSFDGDGVALVQRSSTGTDFRAVALAPDGSIFAGGREFGDNPYESRWFLSKFSAQGSRDPSFGDGGLITYEPGTGGDAIVDLLGLTSGTYATGVIENTVRGLPVARFRADGQFDGSYGTGGFAGTPERAAFGGSRIAVQGRGRIVAFGAIQSWVPTFNQDLYLARYEGTCPVLNVGLDITPPNLNLRSRGRWISATLEPEPPASPEEIATETILLLGSVPVDPSAPVILGDTDADGRRDLTVKFERAAVEKLVAAGESVPITVEGEIADACFEATDHVRTTREPALVLHTVGSSTEFALAGSEPNPAVSLRPTFLLPDAGAATIVAYDIRGRVVARRDVGTLGPGAHALQLSEPGVLPPGVYLVHLIRGERRLVSRAVIVQ